MHQFALITGHSRCRLVTIAAPEQTKLQNRRKNPRLCLPSCPLPLPLSHIALLLPHQTNSNESEISSRQSDQAIIAAHFVSRLT